MSAPYTYRLPDAALVEAVCEGDLIKATIRSVPASEKYEAERMWVLITSAQPEWLQGTLESQPLDMPELAQGTIIRLPRSHVIDVILRDHKRAPPPSEPPQRDHWARCLVDQSVLDGDLKVGYIYRETPDMTKESDKFADSGWRVRGDMRGKLIEEVGFRKVDYVALGAVLNKDDSWLHLIDEPVGARFEKDFEKGVFIRET